MNTDVSNFSLLETPTRTLTFTFIEIFFQEQRKILTTHGCESLSTTKCRK